MGKTLMDEKAGADKKMVEEAQWAADEWKVDDMQRAEEVRQPPVSKNVLVVIPCQSRPGSVQMLDKSAHQLQ